MISKMTITGAIPRTAGLGLHCRRVVPVERERETARERESLSVVDGHHAGDKAGGGRWNGLCSTERERERERERNG
jgi:hypothetical protein